MRPHIEILRLSAIIARRRPLISHLNNLIITSFRRLRAFARLHAMAISKPVIATNVGGTNEVLTNGKTGLLIPPESPSTIANAIVYLIENQEIREMLGRAARSLVVEDFNIQSMVEAYRLVNQKYN
jgi:glycosyltransferase involved in cell wall biosynthesis